MGRHHTGDRAPAGARIVIPLAIIVASAACGGPSGNSTEVGGAGPPEDRAASGDPSPTPSGEMDDGDVFPGSRPGWIELRSPETGLSFEIPEIRGTIRYVYEGHERVDEPCRRTESGLAFGWSALRTDSRPSWWPNDSHTWGHQVAGAVSRDFAAAREVTTTDIEIWRGSDDGHEVIVCRHRAFSVDGITTVRTDVGTALIFKLRAPFCQVCDGPERAAVLNFTHPLAGEFRALTFEFPKKTSLQTIEAILRSVRVCDP